jgi:hypothetical protein
VVEVVLARMKRLEMVLHVTLEQLLVVRQEHVGCAAQHEKLSTT